MSKFPNLVWIVLGIVIGVAAGSVAGLLRPAQYESTAKLAAVPCQIPERFAGAAPGPPIQQSLRTLMRPLLSRGTLTSIIHAYKLYPHERAKLPMEEIIRRMRADVRVWRESEDSLTTIGLSFRYTEPVLAQSVATDLLQHLMMQHQSWQAMQQQMTVQFLRDMSDAAARRWLALKKDPATGGGPAEVAALEIESARKHYDSMRQKLSEAEITDALIQRRQGEVLELLEPPSLPKEPVSPRRPAFLGGGAALGLLAGLAFAAAKRPGGWR